MSCVRYTRQWEGKNAGKMERATQRETVSLWINVTVSATYCHIKTSIGSLKSTLYQRLTDSRIFYITLLSRSFLIPSRILISCKTWLLSCLFLLKSIRKNVSQDKSDWVSLHICMFDSKHIYIYVFVNVTCMQKSNLASKVERNF